MTDPLRARLTALVAEMKALQAVTVERNGYVEYFVSQADVWRVAGDLTALLREPPEALRGPDPARADYTDPDDE